MKPTATIATDSALLLDGYRTRVEAALDEKLPVARDLLGEAMRYSTLNRGKRLRAALVYACGEDFGCAPATLDNAACAVECLHAYSLIHDDLPAMDDADLRRGKPSCHKAFDEATAILAGDALNTLAFSLLAATPLSEKIGLAQIRHLSAAAGWAGMVGGQSRDMAASHQELTLGAVREIHRDKTGALLEACLHLGALPGTAYPQHRRTLKELGEEIGIAYQIIDDMLDVTADTKTLGKPSGKDAIQAKNTYLSHLGLNSSRQAVKQSKVRATLLLDKLPDRAAHLGLILGHLFLRRY